MTPILPVPHNWRDQVELTVTWPTDVQRSRSGQEQRFRLADAPVQRIRYSLTMEHPRSATRLLAVLAEATDGRIRIPRWEDGVRLTQAATATSTSLASLTLDPALRSFEADAEAILWRAVDDYEVVTVASVAPGEITLDSPGLTTDWPQGTWVLPLVPVVLVGQVDLRRYGTASEVPIEVRLAPDTEVGASVAAVVASLTREPGSPTVINPGRSLYFRIIARDARGVILPDIPIEVAHTNPEDWAIHAGRVPGTVVARNLETSGITASTSDITVTAGDVTLQWQVT